MCVSKQIKNLRVYNTTLVENLFPADPPRTVRKRSNAAGKLHSLVRDATIYFSYLYAYDVCP